MLDAGRFSERFAWISLRKILIPKGSILQNIQE